MVKIINVIDFKIIFWLDVYEILGYYGEKFCFFYEELEAIVIYFFKDYIILVDDLCLLFKEGWGILVIKDDIFDKI